MHSSGHDGVEIVPCVKIDNQVSGSIEERRHMLKVIEGEDVDWISLSGGVGNEVLGAKWVRGVVEDYEPVVSLVPGRVERDRPERFALELRHVALDEHAPRSLELLERVDDGLRGPVLGRPLGFLGFHVNQEGRIIVENNGIRELPPAAFSARIAMHEIAKEGELEKPLGLALREGAGRSIRGRCGGRQTAAGFLPSRTAPLCQFCARTTEQVGRLSVFIGVFNGR
jgi:hypothetical protein